MREEADARARVREARQARLVREREAERAQEEAEWQDIVHKDLVADVHTIKHGTRRFRLGPPGAITRPSRSP